VIDILGPVAAAARGGCVECEAAEGEDVEVIAAVVVRIPLLPSLTDEDRKTRIHRQSGARIPHVDGDDTAEHQSIDVHDHIEARRHFRDDLIVGRRAGQGQLIDAD
jgi:hypothetical protein